ncbi:MULTISPECIES: translation initiation factor IF-2 [Candidatus Nitrosocaldus]|uniref:Probable translation initiation factor IF-2 n=1 Tax=Candidatus Nitrosocaldus cavascurensis TaxID=2058097 RepID=A0A2K5AQ32_9ARCH|nr:MULTISPECIES: translation initiation factor IF-2 [Candidatus Nitrosocaldus]SPC33750.1 putative translation initiation factor IF-2 [Candidatus Nitrosocaldus cavascurensis]
MPIRQPVVVVLGHVDSGKTSLLDKIRGTAVQAREAGGITQHIGASFFPLETIREICGPLFTRFGADVKVPGLLVIDTPGHEVFANLRMRGGSAADIAILVVDINKGLEAQTYESIEILKSRKVPFVIALNKLDMLHGWRSGSSSMVLESLKKQNKSVVDELDAKIYSVVGALSRLGFRAEAFYRVKDFTREIAIVPVSARTGEGIAELLAVLIGLTQQYMLKRLEVGEHGRGIVLEVKEETGLGMTANIILLDGILREGDEIMLAKRDSIVTARVKALLLPKPLDEMRDPRDRFIRTQEVHAAAGVKVASPDLDGVLAGSPFYVIGKGVDIERLRQMLESEVRGLVISTDRIGVVLKCDTLGSLEAITEMLKRSSIPIRIADIGHVTKRDVVEASTVREKDRYMGVVLAFNVKVLQDAQEEADAHNVKIFTDKVIYNLVESYRQWVEQEREREESTIFASLTMPCKFMLLKGFVFRRSNPAVFGVEIIEGRLRQKSLVINSEGSEVGAIHQIQDKGKSIDEARKGMQVAVSMNEPVVGRQIKEGEVLYTLPSTQHLKLLNERFKHKLTQEEQMLLDEIAKIRRKVDPLYGYI